MKSILLSTGFAAMLGAFAIAPASAAPIATHGVVLAPAGATDVACQTVRRTTYRNGVKRVVTSRECSRDRYVERRVYREDRRGFRGDRRDYRRYDRPGLNINIR